MQSKHQQNLGRRRVGDEPSTSVRNVIPPPPSVRFTLLLLSYHQSPPCTRESDNGAGHTLEMEGVPLEHLKPRSGPSGTEEALSLEQTRSTGAGATNQSSDPALRLLEPLLREGEAGPSTWNVKQVGKVRKQLSDAIESNKVCLGFFRSASGLSGWKSRWIRTCKGELKVYLDPQLCPRLCPVCRHIHAGPDGGPPRDRIRQSEAGDAGDRSSDEP